MEYVWMGKGDLIGKGTDEPRLEGPGGKHSRQE